MKSTSPLTFFAKNAAISMAASMGFVGLLLAANFGDLRTLIFKSDVGWTALFLLVFFTGISFSLLQFALVLFEDTDDPQDGE